VHADEPEARLLHVQVLAVERHVPSRVRLELPGRRPAGNRAGAATATSQEDPR
jgi:hypothetical protein